VNTTVVRTCGTEQDNVILELACHHYVTVPLDDEQALSFVGAEVECDRHFPGEIDFYLTEQESEAIRSRAGLLEQIEGIDAPTVTRLMWVAIARLRGYGAYSESTTREERCRNLSL
jgi:hypothetical protein